MTSAGPDTQQSFEAALAALDATRSIADLRTALDAGSDLAETPALLVLKHFFETGDDGLLSSAMAEGVRFISKHRMAKGRNDVLRLVQSIRESRNSAQDDDGWQSSETDFVAGSPPEWEISIRFVDKRVNLALLEYSPKFAGAAGTYFVSLEPQPQAGTETGPRRISQIAFSHFEELVSGRASFQGLSCVPSPQLLEQATGFQIAVSAMRPRKLTLKMTTTTDSFECDLVPGDVQRLARWAHAIAFGVDKCAVYLQQRCRMELTARSMAPGWLRIEIRSARSYERHDLSAVVSKYDAVDQLQRVFKALMQEVPSGPRSWTGPRLGDVVGNGGQTLPGDSPGWLSLAKLPTSELCEELEIQLANWSGKSGELDRLRGSMSRVLGSSSSRYIQNALNLPINFDLLTPDERCAVLVARSHVALTEQAGEPLDSVRWPRIEHLRNPILDSSWESMS